MASHIQDEQEERAWPADLKRRKFKDSLVENLQEYQGARRNRDSLPAADTLCIIEDNRPSKKKSIRILA